MRRALICFALRDEAAALSPKTWTSRADILITGIGCRNAEKSVREFLVDNQPIRVFTCGFAGGLDPKLTIGAILFTSDDAGLRAKLLDAGAQPAKFFSAARIATTAAEKQKLRAETGADAVEMESAAIHAVCRERGIPCATVRVISDAAGEDLPLDFNRLAKPDLNLHYGKLALAIAKSPGKIPALLKLRQQTRFAAEQLARVLARVV